MERSKLDCKICGKPASPMYLCKEHYCCEVCGTKKNLCMRDGGVICDECHHKKAKRQVEEFCGDTEYTIEITCPWCGHEWRDSWEASDIGEHKCDNCGNSYSHERDVTVTYSTGRI